MVQSNLIFDADDTLWENNVLFERAIEHFIDYVAHPAFSREQVRSVLNDVEHVNSAAHGYGVGVFERSLTDCLARLRPQSPVNEDDRAALGRMCIPIREGKIELLDGVEATLRVLRRRHRLFMITKGDEADQEAKIEASGLASLFSGIEIVPEKDPGLYRAFTAARGLEPGRTWMIGNSPRSDILPALEAGIGAVFVPHAVTWALEHSELPERHDRLHRVSPIGKLTDFF